MDEAYKVPYISKTTELQQLNDEIGKFCRIINVSSISQINTSDKSGKTECYYTFSPEGYIIDKGKLYDIINDKYMHAIENFYRYSFSPDNGFVYGIIGKISDSQHYISAFNAQTGERLFRFKDVHNGVINSIVVSYDGRYLLTGSDDKTAKLWDARNGNCIRTFIHEKEVKNACFGPGLLSIVTISSLFATLQGEVFIWNIKNTAIRHSIHTDACNICPDCNNKKLLIGVTDGIELFDLETRSFISKCESEDGVECPTRIRFLPDERFALTVSSNKKISFWKLSEKKCIASFRGKGEYMDLHPNGKYVLNYSSENCLLRLEYRYEFPGWELWNEGARPYLDIFLTLHPNWTDDDFRNILTPDFRNRGYAWLLPEGVKAELKKMKVRRNQSFLKRLFKNNK